MMKRPLTPEDRLLVEQYIADLERSAERLPKQRLVAVAALLFCSLLAARCLYHFSAAMNQPAPPSSRLETIEMPADAPPHLWLVAELRRSVLLLETANQFRMLAIFEGVIGLLLALMSIIGFTFLLLHWNDSARHAVLAGMLRFWLSREE
jgi:hypothetical protein